MDRDFNLAEDLPSALYVFVDADDHTVLAALQEEPGSSPPFPMLAVDEALLPRYVHLVRAYGRREGHSYRLFKFSACTEVDMAAVPPVRRSPVLQVVTGGKAARVS